MEFLSIWTKVLALGKLFTWQPYQDTLRQWLETRVDSSHNGFTLGRFREILLLSSFGLVAVLNMPYICIYFHIYIYIFTYIHIHIFTYIHIHIYTYIHILKVTPAQLVKEFSTIENLLQHATPWNQSFWKPGRWAKTTKITTSNNCYLHCSAPIQSSRRLSYFWIMAALLMCELLVSLHWTWPLLLVRSPWINGELGDQQCDRKGVK